MKMKRINLIAFFLASLLSISLLHGDDWFPQPIGPFGTLNNRDNSFAIAADKSQDLLNVDISPGGKSVKKREGYSSLFSLSLTTSPVHGIYNFYDANGSDISLFFNDTRMSASNSGSSVSVLFSTGPFGATYQCTDSLGFAYCANTSRNTLTKTNGSTYSSLSSVSSTGTMVAACPTRLAMAGFSDGPSRVDFSADSDFTTWGTGSLGTSACQFTINAPGAKITHITYAFGRLMWFKDTSFGFIIMGNQPAQSDWVIKTVSYDVGTNDNTSVYREGVLYFRGKDGHIYGFDGSNYQRLTREISQTIAQAQTRSGNSWTQTTSADFSGGGALDTTSIDTNTTSGSVQMTWPDNFDVFRDGSSGSKAVWTQYTSGAATGSTNVNSHVLAIDFLTGTVANDSVDIKTQNKLSDFQAGTTYHFMITGMTKDDGTANFTFALSPTNTTINPSLLSAATFFYMQFASTTTSRIYIKNFYENSDGIVFSNQGDSSLPCDVDVFLSSTKYIVSMNSTRIATGNYSWGALHAPMYAYFGVDNVNNTNISVGMDNFGYSTETGTYYSAVKNAASLTLWDSFSATYQNNGGAHSFFIRSSSNSFSVASSTPSWTAITNGSIPTVSTGTTTSGVYFQFRDDFTITYASATPMLNEFTQNWIEGNASDKAYATYFKDKIWWSVASGAGATFNNTDLVYDTLNQGWTIYDIPSNGFLIRQNHINFGSSSTGNIYRFGDTNSDAGSAINAYWKSKDFFGGNPFTTQEIANISIIAKSVVNSSMTVTYALNGSSVTSYAMNLFNANGNFINKNKSLPAGTNASEFSVKFGNNAADQPFEVFGVQVGVRPKTWIPTP